MNKVPTKKHFKFHIRHGILLVMLLSLATVLIHRLYTLQILDSHFLQRQADMRTLRVLKTPVSRGMIVDRHGSPLALSTPAYAVWINPQKEPLNTQEVTQVATILNLAPQHLMEKISKYKDKEFMYLHRNLIPQQLEILKSLNIAALHFIQEQRRYYPLGEAMAQVLGFTNVDDYGQEGLELQYDTWLKNCGQERQMIIDRHGRAVEVLAVGTAASNHEKHHALELSIDQRLQYLAFKALKEAVDKHQANHGNVVVLDVNTGEVLAMVNYPSFNPNLRIDAAARMHLRNAAVTDYFEAGSVMKPFSMLSVLEHTNFDIHTVVDTSPGLLRTHGGIIREDDGKSYGLLNLPGILKHSSNVGISKLVLDMPHGALLNTYSRLGFGEATYSGFPGESHGVLLPERKINQFELATMAFGYRFAVTSLQLARAYATLGNHGKQLPVSFLKRDHVPLGRQSISEALSRKIVEMLAIASSNSSSNVHVPGYRVSGKSGTVRKLGKQGYQAGRHRSVFAGLAPAINPKFAIVVTVDDPQAGKYYGRQVAAPVFNIVAEDALRLFNIAPDISDTQGVFIVQQEQRHS
jgi:cell division protein FtsI (penicillin-binding protein 3)